MNKKNTFPQGAESQYAAPQIEVIEVETSQNILGGSTAPLPELPGEDWEVEQSKTKTNEKV